jgi:UDPglucose--hexose-1-phosphate uridylyltransferase
MELQFWKVNKRMAKFDLGEHSHRRYNPLTGEWVQVSPHRSKRPWQGQLEKNTTHDSLPYDPSCYLCSGNERSGGITNPAYKSTYGFNNDFSALTDSIPNGEVNEYDLIVAKSERGICRVVCFSPRHDLTIPEMSTIEVQGVVNRWIEEFRELSKMEFVNYIQVFENKGASMGCSNPHPHGQIWAQESIPVEPMKKQQHQLAYLSKTGRSLLADYLKLELSKNERIIMENEHFVVLTPFWAIWPFETMIIPRRQMSTIDEMTEDEVRAMADIYRNLTIRYDNLFQTSFPYSAGIHQAPTDGLDHQEWHWHMVFYPPLLRSASVKKFMVGYEMLANPQRDITPEFAAAKLRTTSQVHYKKVSVSSIL